MLQNPKKNRRQGRKNRLARQEGMTLIEIMIVVIIMAMIATGVAVAVMPQLEKAKIKQAKSDIGAIRTAVQLFLAENSSKCPSVEDLQAERYLDKGKRTTDPWDREFIINCPSGDDPEVLSVGPDGQEGTEDDVR
jgi:general secretion pathway protein G